MELSNKLFPILPFTTFQHEHWHQGLFNIRALRAFITYIILVESVENLYKNANPLKI